MQIHEITESKITEAGALGSFFSGLTGGLTDKFSTSSQPNVAAMNKKITKVWTDYAQQLKAATPDPARYDTLYQQTLTAFVQKNLLGGQPISSAINKQEITEIIFAIAAAKDDPQQVATLMSKLIQQTMLSQQDVANADGVKIISARPAVVQFRNVVYAQNDEGNWANQKTGRVLDGPTQDFLDQELARAGG
jgi:thymidine phosphorylase